MPNAVAVCNMALALVGGGRITAIDTTTPAGDVCALWFDPTVEAVLREHPWNSAMRRSALCFVDDLTPEYGDFYAMVLPTGSGKWPYAQRVWRLEEADIDHKIEQRTLLVTEDEITVGSNLLSSPSAFGASDWTANNTASVTANNTAAPDSTKTADLVTDGAAGSFSYLSQSGTLSDVDAVYVADVWVKAGSAARCTLEVSLSGGTTTVATLELTFSGVTLAVECDQPLLLHSWDVFTGSNSWYHLFLAVTNDDNTACEVRLYPSGKINGAVGDITTCNFWNAKLRAVTPLSCSYVARPATSGGGYDPSGFDPMLVDCIATRLASSIAPRFGKSGQELFELYENKLPKARSIDGQEGMPEEAITDSWLNSRN